MDDEWTVDITDADFTLRVIPPGAALGDPYVFACSLVVLGDVVFMEGVIAPFPMSARRAVMSKLKQKTGCSYLVFFRRGRMRHFKL